MKSLGWMALLWILAAFAAPGQEKERSADSTPNDSWRFETSPYDGFTLTNDRLELLVRLGGRIHLDATFYDQDNRRSSGLSLQSAVADLTAPWASTSISWSGRT